jgi:2,5-furandicarboxylate decarboxylase 1
MSFTDLRQFLACLQERGELVTIDDEIDRRYQVAAYIRKSSDSNGPAFLFRNVRGFDMPIVGGVFCSPIKALLALEAPDHRQGLERFIGALERPLEPRRVATGPCKEVRLVGHQVDLTRLPMPIYSEQDGGAYITMGVVIARDRQSGARNAGIYRMQLRGPSELAIEPCPYTDFHAMLMRAEAENRPLEAAIALGADPVIQLATQARVPFGSYELAIAGALHGQPVEVVACETVDLEVPATAEIVIEGRVRPHERVHEGPFGEFTGYVGPAGQQPVFDVTAVTMRADAMFQAGLTGVPITENHVMKILPAAANLYTTLRQTYPGVTGVHFAPEGGADFLVVIGLRQQYENEAKNLILNALGSKAHPKIVVVTDDDVDIYDMAKVWWAISTRCQPSDDVIVIPRAAGGQLDPSAPSPFASSLLGIDATRPYGKPFPEVVRIPGVDRVPDWTRELLASPAARLTAAPRP